MDARRQDFGRAAVAGYLYSLGIANRAGTPKWMAISMACHASNSWPRCADFVMVSGAIATVRAKSFAGITRRCGVYCPKSQIPCRLFQSGRNSWRGVYDIALLSTPGHRMRRVPRSHTATTMPNHAFNRTVPAG